MNKGSFDRRDASIVIVGTLNPAILTPDWLCRKELISESDRDACNENLQAQIQQGVIAYQCEWFAANVVGPRLTVATRIGSTPRIRDLAAGIFASLPETPVTAMGINFDSDFKFSDAASYYAFGDKLAPKHTWHSIFPPDKHTTGTAALIVEVRDGPRPTNFPTEASENFLRIEIVPSPRGAGIVQFTVNNHVGMSNTPAGSDVVQILMESWERREAESRALTEKLIELI